MFSRLLADVVAGLLGSFVEGVAASQVAASLLRGSFTLRDLVLRRDALEALGGAAQPLALRAGVVRWLSISVRWRSLALLVSVSGVELELAPRDERSYSAEATARAHATWRERRLRADEAAHVARHAGAGAGAGTSGSTGPGRGVDGGGGMALLRSPAATKLLARLARRIKVQLSVERVSIRHSACAVARVSDGGLRREHALALWLEALSVTSMGGTEATDALGPAAVGQTALVAMRLELQGLALSWEEQHYARARAREGEARTTADACAGVGERVGSRHEARLLECSALAHIGWVPAEESRGDVDVSTQRVLARMRVGQVRSRADARALADAVALSDALALATTRARVWQYRPHCLEGGPTVAPPRVEVQPGGTSSDVADRRSSAWVPQWWRYAARAVLAVRHECGAVGVETLRWYAREGIALRRRYSELYARRFERLLRAPLAPSAFLDEQCAALEEDMPTHDVLACRVEAVSKAVERMGSVTDGGTGGNAGSNMQGSSIGSGSGDSGRSRSGSNSDSGAVSGNITPIPVSSSATFAIGGGHAHDQLGAGEPTDGGSGTRDGNAERAVASSGLLAGLYSMSATAVYSVLGFSRTHSETLDGEVARELSAAGGGAVAAAAPHSDGEDDVAMQQLMRSLQGLEAEAERVVQAGGVQGDGELLGDSTSASPSLASASPLGNVHLTLEAQIDGLDVALQADSGVGDALWLRTSAVECDTQVNEGGVLSAAVRCSRASISTSDGTGANSGAEILTLGGSACEGDQCKQTAAKDALWLNVSHQLVATGSGGRDRVECLLDRVRYGHDVHVAALIARLVAAVPPPHAARVAAAVASLSERGQAVAMLDQIAPKGDSRREAHDVCELARQPTTIVVRVSDMQACVGERVRLECAALEGRVTPAAVCEADLIGAVFGRGQGTDADAWPQRATQFVRVKTDARIVAAGTEVIHIDEACIEARQTPLPLADQPRVAIDLTFSPVVIEARSHAISAIGMALDEMQAGSSTEPAAGESVPVQSDAKANTLALALSTPLLALSVPLNGAERCVAAVLGDVHVSFRAESNGKRTAAARSGRVGMLIAAPAQVASVPDRAEPLDIELSGGEVASCSGSDAVEIALDSHVPSNVYELRVRARGVRGRIDSRVKDALVEATQVCSVLADASENSTALGKRQAEDERLSSDGTCESTKCGAADTINTSVDRSAQQAGPVALAWVDIGTTNVGLSDDRGDFAFAQFEHCGAQVTLDRDGNGPRAKVMLNGMRVLCDIVPHEAILGHSDLEGASQSTIEILFEGASNPLRVLLCDHSIAVTWPFNDRLAAFLQPPQDVGACSVDAAGRDEVVGHGTPQGFLSDDAAPPALSEGEVAGESTFPVPLAIELQRCVVRYPHRPGSGSLIAMKIFMPRLTMSLPEYPEVTPSMRPAFAEACAIDNIRFNFFGLDVSMEMPTGETPSKTHDVPIVCGLRGVLEFAMYVADGTSVYEVYTWDLERLRVCVSELCPLAGAIWKHREGTPNKPGPPTSSVYQLAGVDATVGFSSELSRARANSASAGCVAVSLERGAIETYTNADGDTDADVFVEELRVAHLAAGACASSEWDEFEECALLALQMARGGDAGIHVRTISRGGCTHAHVSLTDIELCAVPGRVAECSVAGAAMDHGQVYAAELYDEEPLPEHDVSDAEPGASASAVACEVCIGGLKVRVPLPHRQAGADSDILLLGRLSGAADQASPLPLPFFSPDLSAVLASFSGITVAARHDARAGANVRVAVTESLLGISREVVAALRALETQVQAVSADDTIVNAIGDRDESGTSAGPSCAEASPLHLSVPKLDVSVRLLRVAATLVEDGSPLMRLSLANLDASLSASEGMRSASMDASALVALDLRSADLGMWEPAVESFDLRASVRRHQWHARRELDVVRVSIAEERALNINMSQSIAEGAAHAHLALTSHERPGWLSGKAIRNETGVQLEYWHVRAHTDVPLERICNARVPDGILRADEATGDMRADERVRTHIVVRVAGSSTCSPCLAWKRTTRASFEAAFDVEREGSFSRTITCLVDAAQQGRCLRVLAPVGVCNSLDLPMEVCFTARAGRSADESARAGGDSVQLMPGEYAPIPADLSDDASLRVRPFETLGWSGESKTTHEWSEPLMFGSMLEVARGGRARYVRCGPARGMRVAPPIHCSVLSVPAEVRVGGGSSGAHLRPEVSWLSLSPTLQLSNDLPCDIEMLVKGPGVSSATQEVSMVAGSVDNIHGFDPRYDIQVAVQLQGYEQSAMCAISPEYDLGLTAGSQGPRQRIMLTLVPCYHDSLCVRRPVTVEVLAERLAGGARRVSVSCSLVVFNLSPFDLKLELDAGMDDSVQELVMGAMGASAATMVAGAHAHSSDRPERAEVSPRLASCAPPPAGSGRAEEQSATPEPHSIDSSIGGIPLRLSDAFEDSISPVSAAPSPTRRGGSPVRRSESRELSGTPRAISLRSAGAHELEGAIYSSPDEDVSAPPVRRLRCAVHARPATGVEWGFARTEIDLAQAGVTETVRVRGRWASDSDETVARSLEYGLAFEHVISARHLHKTLVVRARYEFANLTSRTIAYAQEDGPEHVLQPGEVRPVCVTRVRSRALAALGVRAPAWFRVRFDEPGWEASGAFPLDFAGTATLKLRHFDVQRTVLLKLDARPRDTAAASTALDAGLGGESDATEWALGAATRICLSEHDGRWPYRVINLSSVRVLVEQAGVGPSARPALLAPHNGWCEYAWDEPFARTRRLRVVDACERTIAVCALEVSDAPPTYRESAEGEWIGRRFLSSTVGWLGAWTGVAYARCARVLRKRLTRGGDSARTRVRVRVVSEGSLRVLQILDERPVGSRQASVPMRARALSLMRPADGPRRSESAEAPATDLHLELCVGTVGLSLIDDAARAEIAYACVHGLRLARADEPTGETAYELICEELRVDNQNGIGASGAGEGFVAVLWNGGLRRRGGGIVALPGAALLPPALRLRVRQAQGRGNERASAVHLRAILVDVAPLHVQLEDTFARSLLELGEGLADAAQLGRGGYLAAGNPRAGAAAAAGVPALGSLPTSPVGKARRMHLRRAHSGGGGQAHADVLGGLRRDTLGSSSSLSSEGARAPLESTTDRAATSLSLHVDRVRVSALSIFLSYSSSALPTALVTHGALGGVGPSSDVARLAMRAAYRMLSCDNLPLSFRAMELEHRSVVGASAAECVGELLRGALPRYRWQAIGMIFRVLLSADLFANSTGVLMAIAEGVSSFVRHPLRGLARLNADEALEGMAQGCTALAAGAGVAALTGLARMSAFGHRLCVAVLELNQQYLAEEGGGGRVSRASSRRGRAREGSVLASAGRGLTALLSSFVQGVESGDPMRLLRGTLLGVLGAVARPGAAAFHTIFRAAQSGRGAIRGLPPPRVRPPRYLNPVGALAEYDAGASEAHMLLGLALEGEHPLELRASSGAAPGAADEGGALVATAAVVRRSGLPQAVPTPAAAVAGDVGSAERRVGVACHAVVRDGIAACLAREDVAVEERAMVLWCAQAGEVLWQRLDESGRVLEVVSLAPPLPSACGIGRLRALSHSVAAQGGLPLVTCQLEFGDACEAARFSRVLAAATSGRRAPRPVVWSAGFARPRGRGMRA